MQAEKKAALARERLRRRYRPNPVHILFVGEAPPASGRFFYQADSGLYRAVRDGFVAAFPNVGNADLLQSFREFGCYLVDLCGMPVDRLGREQRKQACQDGEIRLSRIIKELQPRGMITVVRSIAANVARAQTRANWVGTHLELPYPGRWHQHRKAFWEALIPVLRAQDAYDLVAVAEPSAKADTPWHLAANSDEASRCTGTVRRALK